MKGEAGVCCLLCVRLLLLCFVPVPHTAYSPHVHMIDPRLPLSIATALSNLRSLSYFSSSFITLRWKRRNKEEGLRYSPMTE